MAQQLDSQWTATELTDLFLRNGVARVTYDRLGRLFDTSPCPDPTQSWHPQKPLGDCLLYVAGSGLPTGHRRVFFGGRLRLVHVVAHELAVGSISEGLHLAHLCVGHPACANPAHGRPVSGRVNAREGGLRKWPDEILSLGPIERCPRCDTVATTTVQVDTHKRSGHCWALICPSHAAAYVRAKKRGEKQWAAKWYRPMTDEVRLLVGTQLAARGLQPK